MPRSHRSRSHGFSLVELSVVVAIVSVVVVMGLDSMALYMNRTAYRQTQERMQVLKEAINKFRFVYGYLPCPGNPSHGVSNTGYGKEQRSTGTCSTSLIGNAYYGDVPVRDLNLPLSFMRDGYGSKISYVVSRDLTRPGVGSNRFSNAASLGVIVVRTGKIEQPCSTNCQDIAVAAYLLRSAGYDKRGAGSQSCSMTTATDGMIDSVNCRFGSGAQVRVGGSGSLVTIPNDVFYDSRFNNGRIEDTHFDDVVVWQMKGQL